MGRAALPSRNARPLLTTKSQSPPGCHPHVPRRRCSVLLLHCCMCHCSVHAAGLQQEWARAVIKLRHAGVASTPSQQKPSALAAADVSPPSPSGSDRSRPPARVPHRQQKRFVIGCYSLLTAAGCRMCLPPSISRASTSSMLPPKLPRLHCSHPSMYDPSDGRPQISACMLPHAASTQGLRRLAYNRERAEGIYPPETF